MIFPSGAVDAPFQETRFCDGSTGAGLQKFMRVMKRRDFRWYSLCSGNLRELFLTARPLRQLRAVTVGANRHCEEEEEDLGGGGRFIQS